MLRQKYLNFELVLYFIFGVIGIGVDMGIYSLCVYTFHLSYIIANVISWVFAATFSYVANKFVVFKNKDVKPVHVTVEFTLFIAARLFSLVYSTGWQIFAIELLKMNELTAKSVGVVLVSVINYLTNKLIVFRKQKNEQASEEKIDDHEESN